MHDWLRCVKLKEKTVGHLKKAGNGKFAINYILFPERRCRKKQIGLFLDCSSLNLRILFDLNGVIR